MARVFRKNSKDLIKLDVLTSDDVWRKDIKGSYILRSDLDIYGKVDKGFSSSVTMFNKKGKNNKFVEDFSTLPKTTKNKVTDMMLNKNKRVAYLVKTKKEGKKLVKGI